jgi:hypothetical protein
MSEGKKYDQAKMRYDLVPFRGLDDVVRVLTYGAQKYSPENWRKVERAEERYPAAALRHISAYLQGEGFDPESGLPHLAHAVCSLLFVLTLDQEASDELVAERKAREADNACHGS